MRIGHEQMAHDPCRFGPFLLVAADAEQVHEPVQVGLEVVLLHPGEAEEVAPEGSVTNVGVRGHHPRIVTHTS